jgi:prephenate dehydratase
MQLINQFAFFLESYQIDSSEMLKEANTQKINFSLIPILNTILGQSVVLGLG